MTTEKDGSYTDWCFMCRSGTQHDNTHKCMKCLKPISEAFNIELNGLILSYGNRLSIDTMEKIAQEMFENLWWQENENVKETQKRDD